MINTAGYDIQGALPRLATLSPEEATNTIGSLFNAVGQAQQQGYQTQQQGIETKHLANVAPAQTQADLAKLALAKKQDAYLAGLSPIASLAIQKNGLPQSTIETGGHMDENGNWVSSVQNSIIDPSTNQSIPFGGQKQVSRPTSTYITTAPGGPNGEPVATTHTLIRKQGVDPSIPLTKYDPASGSWVADTNVANEVSTSAATISHFAPPPRSAAGAAAQALKDAQHAYQLGNNKLGEGLMALYNAQINGDKDAEEKIQAQIKQIGDKDAIAGWKNASDVTNFHLQQAKEMVGNMDDAGVDKNSPAYKRALDTVNVLQTQYKNDVETEKAQTNLKNAQADQTSGKNLEEERKSQRDSATKQLTLVNAALAAPNLSDAQRNDFMQERVKAQEQLKQLNDASGGSKDSASLGNIPQNFIDFLKANPDDATKASFDKQYGAGAADRILGQNKTQ